MLWIPHQLGTFRQTPLTFRDFLIPNRTVFHHQRRHFNYFKFSCLRSIHSGCRRRFLHHIGMFLWSASNIAELLDKSRWTNDTWFQEISVSILHTSYTIQFLLVPHRELNQTIYNTGNTTKNRIIKWTIIEHHSLSWCVIYGVWVLSRYN